MKKTISDPQMSLLPPEVWSVSSLTRYLRSLLARDDRLQDVWLVGEVSNYTRPSSGHLYFTLKDIGSSIRCVMWRQQSLYLRHFPKDGEAIEVHGYVDVYETGGQYQLYVDTIRPAGEGALYQEFIRLKTKLEEEGLFDPERKQPIPEFPGLIGIATSPTGAALQDILNTIRRRYPVVEILIAPCQVQGLDAPPTIIKALQQLEALRPDLILLVRGGGSIEDLWAFNDETLVRHISTMQSPIISGVGHETDFTLVDFVADLRAPTPTAAAELATPNREDLKLEIAGYIQRLQRSLDILQSTNKTRLSALRQQFEHSSPLNQVNMNRQRLDEQLYRLSTRLTHRLELQRSRLQSLTQNLAVLNPEAVLQRGFAVVRNASEQVIRSLHQVTENELISIQVSDGKFPAVTGSRQPLP